MVNFNLLSLIKRKFASIVYWLNYKNIIRYSYKKWIKEGWIPSNYLESIYIALNKNKTKVKGVQINIKNQGEFLKSNWVNRHEIYLFPDESYIKSCHGEKIKCNC